jgi:hypothetical protein
VQTTYSASGKAFRMQAMRTPGKALQPQWYLRWHIVALLDDLARIQQK